jgi:hypothetical protein
LWPTLPYAESSPTGRIFGGLSLQPQSTHPAGLAPVEGLLLGLSVHKFPFREVSPHAASNGRIRGWHVAFPLVAQTVNHRTYQ